jgi:hypothetical protein
MLTGVVVLAWCALWLATYRVHGPSLDGGGVGYVRLALAVGVGLALPRAWTPLLALVVPLAAVGLPSDDEVAAALIAGTVLVASLILVGVLAGVGMRKGGASKTHVN